MLGHPPSESLEAIKPAGPIEEGPVTWLDFIKSKPKAERFSVTTGGVPEKPYTTPMPPVNPPKVGRSTCYKLITSMTSGECEEKLNYYHDKKLLVEVVQLCVNMLGNTVLLKVYKE